jgi:hypothetical protein
MPKNGDPAARATASDLPRARPWLWRFGFSGCVLAGAALIVGPYLLVSDRPAPAPTVVSTTVTWVVVQPALLVLTALLAMYSFGRARIENSALRGLHVDVTEFTDIRTGSAPSARELTAGFTRKLTESRIYSPAALPGAAGSYDFLQVVENVGEAAAASWWKLAARALRLLRPPAAYRVTGTVADSGQPKLVVELMRLPKFAAAPLIIEDTTWDRVLERAANSVAAQIFPRSRICRRRRSGRAGGATPSPPNSSTPTSARTSSRPTAGSTRRWPSSTARCGWTRPTCTSASRSRSCRNG